VPDAANVAEFQGRFKNKKKPHRVNRSGDIASGNAVAFDPNGNVWVTNFDGDSIIAFTLRQFRAPRANIQRQVPSLQSPKDGGGLLDGPEGLASIQPARCGWDLRRDR